MKIESNIKWYNCKLSGYQLDATQSKEDFEVVLILVSTDPINFPKDEEDCVLESWCHFKFDIWSSLF